MSTLTLLQLHERLQSIAGWNMYKLHAKHIEAGDGVRIKLQGTDILVTDEDKGEHTCSTPQQVHEQVRNLNIARCVRW